MTLYNDSDAPAHTQTHTHTIPYRKIPLHKDQSTGDIGLSWSTSEADS